MEVAEELELTGKDYLWIMSSFCVGFLRNPNAPRVYPLGSLGKAIVTYWWAVFLFYFINVKDYNCLWLRYIFVSYQMLAFIEFFFLINNPLRTNLPSLILMLRRKENGINSLSAFRQWRITHWKLSCLSKLLGSTVFLFYVCSIFVHLGDFLTLSIDKSVW